mgnify:CR=1 FL=1
MDDHGTFHLKRETLPNDIVEQMLALLDEILPEMTHLKEALSKETLHLLIHIGNDPSTIRLILMNNDNSTH